MPHPFFPGPDQIAGGLIDDTIRAAAVTLWNGGSLYEVWQALSSERGILLVSTAYSLRLLACGYFAGVAAGIGTGVLIGWFPRFRYWAVPLMKVIGPMPATALVPLMMTVFQGSFLAGAGLIAFAVWFPVTMLTSSGMASVRLSYLDVARTLGAGRLYLIFRVAVPSALPHIFVGLFVGLLTSFLTLVVAETVGVKAGLGQYLKTRQSIWDYPKMYASLLIMAVLFSTLMTLLFKLRDRVLQWQKGVIKW
jgi:NitT/TauT family transport system permease protein